MYLSIRLRFKMRMLSVVWGFIPSCCEKSYKKMRKYMWLAKKMNHLMLSTIHTLIYFFQLYHCIEKPRQSLPSMMLFHLFFLNSIVLEKKVSSIFIAKNWHSEVWMRSRSEEHTSELQSPDHLVCRLLLEKKKYKPNQLESHST